MNNNQYQEKKETVNGIPIKITSYAVGTTFYCHISNVDPGATIARAQGSNRNEAEKLAMEKVLRRL